MRTIIIGLVLIGGFALSGFARETWSPWNTFIPYTLAAKVYTQYSVYYDTNQNSMVIRVDTYATYTDDPNAVPNMSFYLAENSNPKLLSHVNDIISLSIKSIDSLYSGSTGSGMANHAYTRFSLRYNDSVGLNTNKLILGIKTAPYSQY